MKDNNKKFEVNSHVKFPYMYGSKMHWYIPDFIVEGQIVEIKGDHFFKEDGTMQNPFDHSQDGLYEVKHQCMLQNNVKIILQSECCIYMSYVKENYSSDFILNCKMR